MARKSENDLLLYHICWCRGCCLFYSAQHHMVVNSNLKTTTFVRHTSAFKVSFSIVICGVFILFLVIIIFSLLTYFHVRKNCIQDSDEVKKAIVKNLLYLNIAAILSIVYNLVPIFFPLIIAASRDHSFLVLAVVNYCL